MAIILALETSATVCSVAVFQDRQLLALSELQIEKSHSSHITVLVQDLLGYCKLTEQDLSAVAVSGGPGSYTGLRIGSATAKGLCFALDIPLISVPTLQALALPVLKHTPQSEKFWFCPMIDARRMEVYTCLIDHEGREIFPTEPVVLTEQTFAEQLSERPVIFFGNGAEKFKTLMAENKNALFIDQKQVSAQAVGELAYEKWLAEQFEDVAYYEPFYLKEVYITKKA